MKTPRPTVLGGFDIAPTNEPKGYINPQHYNHKRIAKDFLHRMTASLSREFKGYIHGFESLEEKGMFSTSRGRTRYIVKSDWEKITR
jgi:hypothetical protein